MRRARYVFLVWQAGDGSAEDDARQRLEALERTGAWRRRFVEAGWALALETDSSLPLRRLAHGRGIILGDLHPTREGPSPGEWVALWPAVRTSRQVFGALSRRYWGRYVALHQPAALEPTAAFRDPSGALECLSWRIQRLTVVASDLLLDSVLAHPAWGIDWPRVGRCLFDPAAAAGPIAIDGVAALSAGEMASLDGFARELVWSPAAFVRRARAPRAELCEGMRRCVDQVVGACVSSADAILAEVSGGLDSAIVAGALQRAAPGKVAQWINFHTADPEGDERRFARAVGRKLGLALDEASKPELTLTEPRLAETGRGLRPSVAAIDYQYDEDNAQRCGRLGADVLVTGQGGDAVFLQTASALIAADAVRARLPPRLLARVVRDAAAIGRRSVWSVARTAVTAGRGAAAWRAPPYLSRALAAERSAGPAHPWLGDIGGSPPAKRLQIHALTTAQLFNGHSRRSEAADLVHPLLSQPLVEFVLGIPAFDLALGSNDRALAREAFAERLPEEVQARRSKGDLTAYYGRMLSRSLGVVRPYLLEGLLMGEGLLDRAFLETALTPESLLWRDLAPSLIELLALEAWVRHWSARLAGRRQSAG